GGGGGGGSSSTPSDSTTTENNDNDSNESNGNTTTDSVKKIGPTNLNGKTLTLNHTIQGVRNVTFTSSSALRVTVDGRTITGSYNFTRKNDARGATLVLYIPNVGMTRLTLEMEFQNATTAKSSSCIAILTNGRDTTNLNLGGGTLYFY
ncbi:MAG: hypothetical protein IJ503_05160, partial [Akkermansia sp.]|nr:hypothetical protein [Akkermansia sp.]